MRTVHVYLRIPAYPTRAVLPCLAGGLVAGYQLDFYSRYDRMSSSARTFANYSYDIYIRARACTNVRVRCGRIIYIA